MDWSSIAIIVSAVLTAIATSFGWINNQLNSLKKAMAEMQEKVLTKLEYHERHDDIRFAETQKGVQNVRDDVWMIRVRNAAKDGMIYGTTEESRIKPGTLGAEASSGV